MSMGGRARSPGCLSTAYATRNPGYRAGEAGRRLEAGKRLLLITEREGGTDPLFFQAG